jgi:hypothetical protein
VALEKNPVSLPALLARKSSLPPFTGVGVRFAAAGFLRALAMEANITPPLTAINGKDHFIEPSSRMPCVLE